MSTQELINTLSRYDSRGKVKNNRKTLLKIGLEKIAKIQNISKKELNQAKKLQRKSKEELRGIARLRRIKSSENLPNEELLTALLKSERSTTERNFKKLFNNNINDDTYDDDIRGKISDINMILSRLGNIVTKNDRRKIKKEFYEIENKKNLSEKEKEEIYDHLVKLVKTLDKKEKYQYQDRNDLDYYGITDIEDFLDNVDDYYKPILIKSSFKDNYKYYESRGDKDKKLSVKQYLYMIMPHVRDIINDNKAIRNNSNEWKIQINMHVNFISSKDTGETRTIYIWSDNEEIRLGKKQMILLMNFLNLS